ncbi:hypothetical protein [Streptomyces sp. NPDC002564]|uniref:hypothetical protein n=1 Tax=Streptomyces sp. NPDC002564 TaxID=3364649 RepID=UPI00367C666F
MPTTRHHLNNLRRRQAREALRTPPATEGSAPRGAPRSSTATEVAETPEETRAQPRPARTWRPGPGATATSRPASPTPATTKAGAAATDTAKEAAETADAAETATDSTSTAKPKSTSTSPAKSKSNAKSKAAEASTAEATDPPREKTRRPSVRNRTLVALCLVTLLLGGFAGWAQSRADALNDAPAARNSALSDTARTSEIKGQAAKAVAVLFSYDHADAGTYDKTAKRWLTGRAVAQHRDLLGGIRTRADRQKAVITTTVTDSAVERIDGDRARVLVYADQSSVSTAGGKKAEDNGSYAGAMLAVDVERHGGRWLVSGIDTFSR